MQGLLCWLQGSAEDTSLELVPCSRTSCAPEQALHQATTRPLRESLRALQVPASPSDRTPHCAVITLRAYRCFHTLLIVQGSVRNRRIITLFTLQLIQTTSIPLMLHSISLFPVKAGIVNPQLFSCKQYRKRAVDFLHYTLGSPSKV